MLLVNLTINSVLNRISDEPIQLTNDWEPAILSFRNPIMSMPYIYGGYCRLTGGGFVLKPSLFDDDWPPPKVCPIEVKYTATTEAAAVLIFRGTAEIKKWDYKGIDYVFKMPEYTEEILESTALNDTLNNVIESILVTSSSGIAGSLNTTYARATSPNVSWTTDKDMLAINLASEIAASFSHLIYIDNDTGIAYLVDTKIANGETELTEYDFFPPEYIYADSVASITESTTGYTRISSYSSGKDKRATVYHSTESNVNTALDDMLDILNKDRCSVDLPISGGIPLPGRKLKWLDTRVRDDTDVELFARTFRFDLLRGFVNVEGDATITLWVEGSSPSPSPSVSPSTSISASPSATPSSSPSATPSTSISSSPSVSTSASISVSVSSSPSASPSASPGADFNFIDDSDHEFTDESDFEFKDF